MTAKKVLILLLKIIVSGLLLIWLCSGIDWRDLLRLTGAANPFWLGAAVCWIAVSILLSAYKWSLIFQAMMMEIPLLFLWRSYWAGIFCNNFLPSSIGGDGLRIYLSGRFTGDIPSSTASVILERLLATLGLALAALICYPFSPIRMIALVLFFAAISLISLFLIYLIFSPQLLQMLRLRFKQTAWLAGFLDTFQAHGARLGRNKRLLMQALLWSAAFQFSVVIINYCIFRALGIDQISLIEAAVLIPATSVAAMLPVGINGYGTREGAYVALFAVLGVSQAEAMAASISFALLVTVASLYGGWLLLRENLPKGGSHHGETDRGESRPVFFSRQ